MKLSTTLSIIILILATSACNKPDNDSEKSTFTGTGQCPRQLAPPTSGHCNISAGTANLLIQGNVLRPQGILEQAEVLVVDGSIACVGCDCSGESGASSATVLTCADSLVTPGLINAYDRLNYSNSQPVILGEERYDHRHEWRFGLNGHTKFNSPTGNAADVQWSEIRQVMAGTTSIVGMVAESGMLRNLDKAEAFSLIPSHNSVSNNSFPLNDNNGATSLNCADYQIDTLPTVPYSAFIAEIGVGVNNIAANEFNCIAGVDAASENYLSNRTALVDVIPADADQLQWMAATQTALVWTPRSNTYLYGSTTPIPVFKTQGGTIALGTDWTISGSVNLLREMQCASQWNRRWSQTLSDADIVNMVTTNAASLIGYADSIGSLAPGMLADIAVWDASIHSGVAAVLNAENKDVVLVLRGGVALYGDDALVTALTVNGDCEAISVCGSGKRVCAQRELGAPLGTLGSLISASQMPLYFCDTPANEPSCVPARLGEYTGVATVNDNDGDGVANDSDNCVNDFNPILPSDNGVQRDTDGDGIGDVCDATPHHADTTPPTPPPPPPPGPTDTTIYNIQTGVITAGTVAIVKDVVVTGTWANGAWVQDPTSSDGKYAGIQVFSNTAPNVVIGDVVTVQGTVLEYFGDTELNAATMTVTGSATPPPPFLVSLADAASEVYQGVLVQVTGFSNVITTDCITAVTCPATLWPNGNDILIDFFIYQNTLPSNTVDIKTVTGIMRYNFNLWRIMPRTAADIVY